MCDVHAVEAELQCWAITGWPGRQRAAVHAWLAGHGFAANSTEAHLLVSVSSSPKVGLLMPCKG